jgi:general secretion pathway protein B
MSYILDALKKSEQARQHNTPAKQYSLLPVIDEEAGQRRLWPYGAAALLIVNAAVLGYWLRPTLSAEPQLATTLVAPTPLTEKTAGIAPPDSVPVESPARLASTATAASKAVIPQAAGIAEAPIAAVPAQPAKQPSIRPSSDAASAAVVRATHTNAASANSARTAAGVDPASKSDGSVKTPTPATATVAAAAATQVKAKVAEVPKPAAPADRGGNKTEANEAVRVAKAPESTQAAGDRSSRTMAATETNPAPQAANQRKEPANRDELPPALQKELPSLAVSGFIRDGDAEGMVIVNDRLLRAGDEAAPGIRLEKILKENLVFSYKGYRFTR